MSLSLCSEIPTKRRQDEANGRSNKNILCDNHQPPKGSSQRSCRTVIHERGRGLFYLSMKIEPNLTKSESDKRDGRASTVYSREDILYMQHTDRSSLSICKS